MAVGIDTLQQQQILCTSKYAQARDPVNRTPNSANNTRTCQLAGGLDTTPMASVATHTRRHRSTTEHCVTTVTRVANTRAHPKVSMYCGDVAPAGMRNGGWPRTRH